MKAWITLEIGPYDNPVPQLVPADEDDDTAEAMTLWLSDDVSLTGARPDVERWVRALAMWVAGQEGGTNK